MILLYSRLTVYMHIYLYAVPNQMNKNETITVYFGVFPQNNLSYPVEKVPTQQLCRASGLKKKVSVLRSSFIG